MHHLTAICNLSNAKFKKVDIIINQHLHYNVGVMVHFTRSTRVKTLDNESILSRLYSNMGLAYSAYCDSATNCNAPSPWLWDL